MLGLRLLDGCLRTGLVRRQRRLPCALARDGPLEALERLGQRGALLPQAPPLLFRLLVGPRRVRRRHRLKARRKGPVLLLDPRAAQPPSTSAVIATASSPCHNGGLVLGICLLDGFQVKVAPIRSDFIILGKGFSEIY